jgi:hypothetical protein
MDYSKIMADPSVGTSIGRLYLSAPDKITPLVTECYRRFAEQVDDQYRWLLRDVRVTFTDASELFRDIRRGSFAVYATQEDQRHPILTPGQNNRFRAVHDYYGHFRSGRGFDRHGEEAAWVCHSQMFAGQARRAMTSETRGQSSAFIWVNGGREFPPQRAVILPEWVSEIPVKWLV